MQKFAGEHLVLDELKRLGFKPELLPKKGNNAPEIKVNNKTLQVRTKKDSTAAYTLHSKAEKLSYDNYFYVFINMNEDNKPLFRIVPSKDVAESVNVDHNQWLNASGRDGQLHNDNTLRKFYDREGKYLNQWNILK
jgi:hypothetical protein